MRVIKDGDINKKKMIMKTAIFSCGNCGCEWECDHEDPELELQQVYDGSIAVTSLYTCNCPNCGKIETAKICTWI